MFTLLSDTTCPVCGFQGLDEPPVDHSICPCCGTHFEYDDFGLTADEVTRRRSELRIRWLASGSPWFSTYTPPPAGWNPVTQWFKAGLGVRLAVSDAFNNPRRAPLGKSWGRDPVRRVA